jgi:hypothetical protein
MARARPVWHSAAMTRPPRAAGGFFLIVAILVGFGLGVARGAPLPYTILGTLAGIALALLVWLLDRRGG